MCIKRGNTRRQKWNENKKIKTHAYNLVKGELTTKKIPCRNLLSHLKIGFSYLEMLRFVCASWSYVCMIISGNVGESYQIWQVSCRRQGMLTQGPAPDPKSTLVGFHVWYCPLVAELYFCWKAGACVLCTCPSGSQILILKIKSQRKAADIAWCKPC